MQLGSSSTTVAGILCTQHAQLQLLCNAVHALSAISLFQGGLQRRYDSQQQAWLPQHKAAASLVSQFHSVTQQAWAAVSKQCVHQHETRQQQPPGSTNNPSRHAAGVMASHKPSSTAGGICLSRQHATAIVAAAAACSFTQSRYAHTAAATSRDDPHFTAHPLSSTGATRERIGRSHRPLFNQPGSSGTSRFRPASASDSDAEEEWEQADVLEPTDLRNPEQWYPAARAMAPRSLVAHLGPTNSGKTHAALAALAAAPSGVYCGPLRLLACEVADRLNSMGVPCNLVTGQEVRRVKGARHTACTVEMADLTTQVDVGVLDEAQMLGDKGRGWSWTRVLLGLPAGQLHLCGDPAAAGLLEQLAAECGDELTVKRYRRLAPLVVQPEALGGLNQIQDGDCVVAFGRKTLHKLRKNILQHMAVGSAETGAEDPDRAAGDVADPSSSDSDSEEFTAGESSGWYSNSCSSSDEDSAEGLNPQRQQQQRQQEAAARAFQGVGMVYGALPPESRRTQAALFNARGDAWPRTSVLVASDAVGMGLNLNIRRIVFTTLHKFDGVETRPLSASEIKQIAGRAGRYASGHAEGYVSVLNAEDLPLLREALATATPHVTQACLLPRFEQLEQFALDFEDAQQHRADLGRQRQRPLSFHKLLKSFVNDSQLSGAYFLADMKNMMQLAKMLRHIEPYLGLADMYTCCISPATADDGPVVQALLQIAAAYAYDRHVTPDCISLPCPDQPPRSPAEMKTAEELFRVYDLYLWLCTRLGAPGVFRGRRHVLKQREHVAGLIDVALKKMGGVPTSSRWGVGSRSLLSA